MESLDLTDPLVLQAHVSSTFLPLSSVTRLNGGFSNLTLRGKITPPSSALVHNAATVVIKHAEPFAALNRDIALDPIRCHFEHVLIAASPPAVTVGELTLKTPTAYHYDKEHYILVLSDAGKESKDLKALLLSPSASSLKTTVLGRGLGVFLRSLHTWGGTPELIAELAKNTQGATIWRWATYGRLMETVDRFPSILAPYRAVFDKVIAAPELDDPKTLLHGDFWCGNVLLSPEQDVATVIDWEMAKLGHVWGDIAQMCAELYLPFQFHGITQGVEVLDAFLKTYGELSGEAARRVVVHFGVHLVVWPCRVPGWGSAEAVEDCVKVGAEFIERGWRMDWKWVRGSVLKAVVKKEWIKN